MSRKRNSPRLLQQVTIQDYAAEGKSVSRVEGKVIFIEGAVPGDIVDARLPKVKDWGEGKAIHFHSFSEQRTEPFANILEFVVAAMANAALPATINI